MLCLCVPSPAKHRGCCSASLGWPFKTPRYPFPWHQGCLFLLSDRGQWLSFFLWNTVELKELFSHKISPFSWECPMTGNCSDIPIWFPDTKLRHLWETSILETLNIDQLIHLCCLFFFKCYSTLSDGNHSQMRTQINSCTRLFISNSVLWNLT